MRIGYDRLSIPERRVYDRFARAFEGFASTVDATDIDRSVDVMKVLQVALGDDPTVVYFDKTHIRTVSSLFGGRQVLLHGAMAPEQAKSTRQRLEAAVDRAAEEIRSRMPVSTYEKLLAIYEYLQEHVTYDRQELEACRTRGHSVHPMSHNACGPLLNGTGVCDGIAAAFALLAQRFGFACTCISGKAAFCSDSPSDHGWNLLRVGDSFYHMDATWDINHREQSGEFSYEYFAVTDDIVSRDHSWDIRSTPPCSREDLSYYRRSGCLAHSLSQLEDIFAKFAKSNQRVVRARLAEGVALPQPETKFLGQKLIKVASSVGRYAGIRYTWNENTRCFFAKFES